MRIVATIEVRMGSSRVPGKSMADIAGKPLLERVIDRIRLSKKIDDIVVATTVNPIDKVIEDFAKQVGVRCYRGSEEDVLKRVVDGAIYAKADITVQFGGDSPFIDWRVTDELIQTYLDNPRSDLVTNCLKLTYPLGIYAYVVPTDVMRKIETLAKKQSEREDVTRYLWENQERFKLINKEASGDLRRPELRLTVDYLEDIELACRIYSGLYPKKSDFTTIDVIKFLDDNPELKKINARLIQKSAPHIKASR